MQYIVQLTRDINVFGNVVMIELEIGEFEQFTDILKIAGDQVIQREYIIIFFDEPVT